MPAITAIPLPLTSTLKSIYGNNSAWPVLGKRKMDRNQTAGNKRTYNFPEIGNMDIYLLHHEEIESLAKT